MWRDCRGSQPCAQKGRWGGEQEGVWIRGHTWVLGDAREEWTPSNPASISHPGNRHQASILTFQMVLPDHMSNL